VGLEQIEHIVVLMMENRSFDNLLGWLYDARNRPPFDRVPAGQAFEGLAGRKVWNVVPEGVPGAGQKVRPLYGSGDRVPSVDPGETYPYVYQQMYGDVFQEGQGQTGTAPMSGFLQSYVGILREDGVAVTPQRYREIMQCFTPAQVPVISKLAHHYAVCDQWFSSVPSQTWTNRSFFHAGTSNGLVTNAPYVNWLANDGPTVLNRLEEAKVPWRVYFDRSNVVSLTLCIHFPQLVPYWSSRFSHMERFYEECREGTLPAYSFLEPRFIFTKHRNDQHPPYSVAEGEQLIYDVYQAVRKGRNWEKTLLVITYDEHGGCYDHVSPPCAVPPDGGAGKPGQFGFRFDQLGVRVGTVLVSPYIEAGTVFRARDRAGREVPLDHTSMIKTITKRWGLPGLTERDRAALDVGQVLTRTTPRTDEPAIGPRPLVRHTVQGPELLTGMQRDVIALLSVRVGEALAMVYRRREEQGLE